MSSREPYRYISYDSRDSRLVQFYVREIDTAPYLNFTYLSTRDQRWVDIIQANDVIFFLQNNVDVGSAVIAAPYDSDRGFRLEGVPSPALTEGQYYAIDYSRDRPEEDRDVPIENRGFSPVLALQSDGDRVVMRVSAWVGGRGTPPPLGFIGLTGLVSDIANAVDVRGTMGIDSKWTDGTAFPASPNNHDYHLFSEAVTSGLTNYYQADGTTAKTAASAGEIARYDGTKWVFVMLVSTSMSAFSDTLVLGTWENANGGAVSGHYVRRSDTQIQVSYTNIANENKETEIRAIQVGHGLQLGDKIFVVEYTNEDASYREFNGFWVNGEADATAADSQVSISVIQHELRMIRFLTAAQLKKALPEVQIAYDKTVDIHLQETIGEFANMNDATIAGISLILKTTESDRSLRAGTYNFGALTWQTTSVDIPNDSDQYYVVVRIAKASGRIETQFQVVSSDERDVTEYLRGSIQEDANWRYYQVVADYDSIWTLQRRGTTTHTRWDAPLGDIPISQMEALIPDIPENEGLTPQQKAQFESLVSKTADLILETRETWVAATDASFLALPADNAQLIRVRAGNVPQGLTGWTTDVTTTEPRVILIRVPTTAQLADYRILLGDDNAVRLDAFGVNATGTQYAYMTSTSLILQEASRIRLQHHGSTTHTRFIGMLAEAIMARLLPTLPAEGSRDNKVAQFEGDNLVWEALTAGGLTTGQLARLLPTPPSEGDRNDKIAQFVNDVLTWKAIEGYVTQSDFDNRHNHTPNRLSHLPARLLNKELVVLESTTHWADEFYRVMPTTQRATAGGTTWTYRGNNIFAFSTELPVFGNTGLPSIFRSDRIAAIYTRQEIITDSSIPINIKIILDKALIPTIPDSQNPAARNAYYAGLRLNFRGALNVSVPLAQSAFFADEPGTQLSDNEKTFGGKTYVAVTPVLDGTSETETEVPNLGTALVNVANNGSFYDFHISYTDPDTDAVTFLSDDSATAWVSGNEYPAGLYEGDGNGHPIEVIAPVSSVWEEVLAKSDTYIRAAAPNNRFGVDGNKWFNLANGKGYIKQSGSWVEVTDFALESEITSLASIEKSAPFHWYADTFLSPGGSSSFGGSGSIERISSNSVTFYGAENLLSHRDGSRLLFRIDGTASTDSTAAAGGSVKVSVVDSRNVKTEIGTLALTGSDTTDLPFTFEGEVTALPGNAVRIAFESTGIPTSNLNTWAVSNIKVGATVVLDRLLPALPAAGSRNDKILRFQDDNLAWEDLAVATGSPDGKVIFGTSSRPANDVGKIGDTYLRRLSTGIVSLYEKTATATWTYRYDLLLMPAFPASGSRDDKILRFDGNALGWEDLSTTGISAAQIARLLPTLPAEGSRDRKFPLFNNDVLQWQNFPSLSGTLSNEWADIAANTTIAEGTIVYHSDSYYGCINTHTKGGTGPDGDSTNWLALSNWGGTWTARFHPPGTLVSHAGNVYVSLQQITSTDVAPDNARNTKWLQINNTEPPVRFIELSINSGITLPGTTSAAAVALTYAATLAKSNANTGFLSRHASGNQITLKAGVYLIETHVLITQGNRFNNRTAWAVQLFNGATMIDEKSHLDYLRGYEDIQPQSVSSQHTIVLASDANIQIRMKISASEENNSITFTTPANGVITVRRL